MSQNAQRPTRPSTSRLIGVWLMACVIAIGAGACSVSATSTSTETPQAVATTLPEPESTTLITPASGALLVDATFVRIVDGDTIIVRVNGNEQRVRLIGIDTPEINKPDGPVECYAQAASDQTNALIAQANDRIQLERDVSETDKFGRLLRYVWLITPQGRQLLNEELVEGGYARAVTYRPDIKYQVALNRDQMDARKDGRGLWGACE